MDSYKTMDELFELSLSLMELDVSNERSAIEDALAKVAELSNADRVYVFDYDFKAGTATNTYEWCRGGVGCEIENLQNVPIELFHGMVDTHKRGEYVHVPDVSLIKDEDFRLHLEEQKIKSLLVLPLMLERECLGFVGFDRCASKEEFNATDLGLLKLFAKLLVTVKKHRDAQREVEINAQRLDYALKGSNDGLWDWNIQSSEVYFSPRWKEMLGFEEAEISGSLQEWEQRVHPQDLKTVYKDLTDHLEGKTPYYVNEHRVLSKNGEYIWVLDRGKIVEYDQEGIPLRMAGTHTDISDRIKLEEAINSEKAKYKSMMLLSSDGIFITSCETGELIEFNKQAQKLLAYSDDEMRSLSVFEWDKELRREEYMEIVTHLSDRFASSIERVHTRKDGSQYIAAVSAIKMHINQRDYVCSTVRDISKERQHSKEIMALKNRYEKLFENSPDTYFIVDPDSEKIIDCNEAAEVMFGAKRSEIIGLKPEQLSPLEQPGNVLSKEAAKIKMNELFEKETIRFEWVQKKFDGTLFWTEVTGTVTYMDDKKSLLFSLRDITKVHNMSELLKEQSMTDELTKLLNRKAYNLKLDEMLAEYKRYQNVFSFLMFDIDFFKAINDTYGHILGDLVLIDLSRQVKSIIRNYDHFYRIGGEEFVVLLSNTNLENGKIIAEKIRKVVEEKVQSIEGQKVTISIGLTQVEEDDTADSIFIRADENLYKAKELGRNRIEWN